MTNQRFEGHDMGREAAAVGAETLYRSNKITFEEYLGKCVCACGRPLTCLLRQSLSAGKSSGCDECCVPAEAFETVEDAVARHPEWRILKP